MTIFKRQKTLSADNVNDKQALYFKIDKPFVTSFKIGMGISLGAGIISVVLLTLSGFMVNYNPVHAEVYQMPNYPSPLQPQPGNGGGQYYIFPE